MKKAVAIIFGGKSSEHDFSCKSGLGVLDSISTEKYDILPIYITKTGKWLMYDGKFDNTEKLKYEKFRHSVTVNLDPENKSLLRMMDDKIERIHVDVIFPVLHGINGEDGTVQGLLELSGIPYVGCGVFASALSIDKVYTKQIIKNLSVEQAEYLVICKSDMHNFDNIRQRVSAFGYPVFVKPSNAGSSVGISKVKNELELRNAVETAFLYGRKTIVERVIDGREFVCAVIGNYIDAKASIVGEVVTNSDYYSYNDKCSPQLIIKYNTNITDEIENDIRKNAIHIFKAIECYGLSRVDFFLTHENKVIFNEINTMPALYPKSAYPELWNHTGLQTEKLIDTLIDFALAVKS